MTELIRNDPHPFHPQIRAEKLEPILSKAGYKPFLFKKRNGEKQWVPQGNDVFSYRLGESRMWKKGKKFYAYFHCGNSGPLLDHKCLDKNTHKIVREMLLNQMYPKGIPENIQHT
jgi:hypothetical protein